MNDWHIYAKTIKLFAFNLYAKCLEMFGLRRLSKKSRGRNHIFLKVAAKIMISSYLSRKKPENLLKIRATKRFVCLLYESVDSK